MSGYEDILYAQAHSHELLPRYSQGGGPRVHQNTLIERVATELEDSLQAPRELIFTKLLSALSISLQPLVDVETPDGRIIPVSSYFIALAKTGERKTGIENKVYKPIEDFQNEQEKIYIEELKEYEKKTSIFDEKLRALKKELRRKIAKEEDTKEVEAKLDEIHENQPKQPKEIRLVYTDSTSEALIDGMSHGNRFVAIASGEGGTALKSSAIKDYPLINSLWGGETAKKDRKTTQSSRVVDGRLSISLDVQPQVFDDFLKKHGDVMHASGFFSRAFLTMPLSRVGSRYFMKTDSQDSCYREYIEKLSKYLNELPGIISDKETRRVVKLSKCAEKKFIHIANAIEYELNPNGLFFGYEGYGSKHAEKILRIACLLSVFESDRDQEIEPGAIDHAVHWGMYFTEQHRQIFNYVTQEEQEDKRILEWINKKRNMRVRFYKKNEMRRRMPEELRKARTLDLALERLEQRREIVRFFDNRTEWVDMIPWHPAYFGASPPTSIVDNLRRAMGH